MSLRYLLKSLPVSVLLLLCACEGLQEEEVVCLPINMTASIIQGTESKKIIADFHYVPGTERLDHITWSNHQTHYFEYDTEDRIAIVRKVIVDQKVQDEMWFRYDGARPGRVDLVRRKLDYIFLEPVDSSLTGCVEYEYEGSRIVEEVHHRVLEEEDDPEPVLKVEYTYDNQGNISSKVSTDLENGSMESWTMTYSSHKHPLSDLRYYFQGESYVNHMLSKASGDQDLEYRYEFRLNTFGYPETVYEKLGITNARIVRYSYLCE